MDIQKSQKNYEEDMSKIIFQNVLLRVADDLTEEQKEQLSTLLQQPSTETAAAQMLHTAIPNINEIIVEETKKIEDEVQELMADIGDGTEESGEGDQ